MKNCTKHERKVLIIYLHGGIEPHSIGAVR